MFFQSYRSFDSKWFDHKIMTDRISKRCSKTICYFYFYLIFSLHQKIFQIKAIWFAKPYSCRNSIDKHLCYLKHLSQIKLCMNCFIHPYTSLKPQRSRLLFPSGNFLHTAECICRNVLLKLWIRKAVCKTYRPFFR